MLTLKDRVPAAAQVDAEFAWSVALLLGLIFTLGMLTVDAANGLWVYRLIAASGEGARRASRGLTLAIALLSLALAMIGLARLTSTGLDGWYDVLPFASHCFRRPIRSATNLAVSLSARAWTTCVVRLPSRLLAVASPPGPRYADR